MILPTSAGSVAPTRIPPYLGYKAPCICDDRRLAAEDRDGVLDLRVQVYCASLWWYGMCVGLLI